MFKLVHYEGCTVGNRVVGILLSLTEFDSEYVLSQQILSQGNTKKIES